MASVCIYFQVHQPFRLRRYSVFDTDPFYFNNDLNRQICEKVAEKCYRPATRRILDLVRRHEGRFRVSYAITGTVLEQLQLWAPDVIELFQQLAETGACEFIGETSHHSLSFLFSRDEFDAQVDLHDRQIRELFNQSPRVFRNTELIYSNALAAHIAGMKRYKVMLCEGVDGLLGFRSPNYVYVPPTGHGRIHESPVRLLLKNFRLSDDIAFRFSDRNWKEWPLRAETFAKWVDQINGNGYVCNLFMDYETLGEHQWQETGIFDFLDVLPEKIFDVNPGQNDFALPSEAAGYEPVGEYDVPHPISWADTERDLTAWLGNAMQDNAIAELYRLEPAVKARHESGDAYILEDWRKLTTSDHFYYMCTKFWADGDVHKYFSPYDSPYDAYINFMNVLDNIRARAGITAETPRQASPS
jgi:alpha-amylase